MRISVIMPVYNCAAYAGAAIDSVLKQDFGDFEFIIVEDCSTDDTQAVVREYALMDRRIVVLENGRNHGLAACVNMGLKVARGEFVARMDGDDVCAPGRFARQVAFMDRHPEITVCGGWHRLIGAHGARGAIDRFVCRHDEIRAMLFWQNPMSHPTVMIRRGFLMSNNIAYVQEAFPHVEDYDLWKRMIFDCGATFANLPEVFLYCRKHPDNTSRTYGDIRIEIARKTWGSILGMILGAREADKCMDIHLRLNRAEAEGPEDLREMLAYLYAFNRGNKSRKVCSDRAMKRICARKFFAACRLCRTARFRAALIFLFSPWFPVYCLDFAARRLCGRGKGAGAG